MKPKSHDEFRASVCIGCHKSGVKTVVSPAKIKLVQDVIFNGFSLDYSAVPYGLCDSCRMLLNRGNYMPKFNYDALTKSMKRISNGEKCNCYICTAGRSKKRNKVKKLKPGPKPSNGDKEENEAKVVKICSKCKQVVGKGIRHPCLKRNQADNLMNLATDQTTRHQFANKVIKESVNEDSTVKLTNTQGKSLPVTISPQQEKQKPISFEQLDKLRTKGKFSDNTMTEVVTPFLRETLGRDSVQAYYKAHMIEMTEEMKQFFVVKDIIYQGRDHLR